MNKIVIPAILIVTVFIAGIFAFMPIDKATTVHTTLATTASVLAQTPERDVAVKSKTDIGTSTIDLIDVSVDKDFTVEIGQFLVESTSGDGTVIVTGIKIEDGDGNDFDTIEFADETITANTGRTVFPSNGTHAIISMPSGWSIIIEGKGGNVNSDSKVMLGIIAAGDATITVA